MEVTGARRPRATVHEDRLGRDLRRYQLARRLVAQGLRTQTISRWTGLSADRIQRIAHATFAGCGPLRSLRLCGPVPRDAAVLLRAPALRTEAAALAVLLRLTRALPAERIPEAARKLPSVTRGEQLCTAVEVYRATVPGSTLSFDQAVLLLLALAEGEALALVRCAGCEGALLIDPLGDERRLCAQCRAERRLRQRRGATTRAPTATPPELLPGYQPSLF